MNNTMITNKEIICDMLNNNTKDLATWIYYIVNNGCHGRPDCPAFAAYDKRMSYICDGSFNKERCIELWEEWLNKEYTRDVNNNESERTRNVN